MKLTKIFYTIPLLLGLSGCTQVPKTLQQDDNLPYTEIDGYKYHSVTYGDENATPLIIIHGGPGGDFNYLLSLKQLSKDHHVILYDQKGSGLSPRVQSSELTLEKSIEDLHAIVKHFSKGKKVKLIGHSWGAMLAVGYLGQHPSSVSQAVIIEPGMLDKKAANAYVKLMKESRSISDVFAMAGYISIYPFVKKIDGHEGYDYVMTRVLNRNKPGKPYQCEGESLPKDTFKRGGYESFSSMLKPLFDNPDDFTYDLTKNISAYKGDLLLISSECSLFGYEYQKRYHLSKLPPQTLHVKAEKMGHNMVTLNPEWSLDTIGQFLRSK